MASTVVPQIEIDRLVQLTLDQFKAQYNKTISPSAVNKAFINPRAGFQQGLEISSTDPNNVFRIRVYMNFKFQEGPQIFEFKPEDIQGVNELNTFRDARYVAMALLPRSIFPTLSKVHGTPPSGDQVVIFDPLAYNVVSGQTVNLRIIPSNTPESLVSSDLDIIQGSALAGLDYAPSNIGSVEFDTGSTTPVLVPIKTGAPYYYYWRPRYIDLDDATIDLADLGLGVSAQTTASFEQMFSFTSLVAFPETGQFAYHEFLFENTTYDSDFWVYVLLDRKSLDETTFEEDYYVLEIGFHASESDSTKWEVTVYVDPEQLEWTFSTLIPRTDAFTLGFLFNSNWGYKVQLNGKWMNLLTGEEFDTPSQANYTTGSFMDGFTGDPRIAIEGIFAQSNSAFNTEFAFTALVDSAQQHRPPNVIDTPLLTSPGNGGQFTARLSNSTDQADTATVTISSGNVCYPKIVVNNNYSDRAEMIFATGAPPPY